jgi:hypothetical protein
MLRQWLTLPQMRVPYVDTINREQTPNLPMWCTAEFNGFLRERLTFCPGMTLEEGDIELVYFGQAGIGDDALLLAVEQDMTVLMAQRDPAHRLILDEAGPPDEFFGGSASRYYGISVVVQYSLYSN